jgi:hypothetical protein
MRKLLLGALGASALAMATAAQAVAPPLVITPGAPLPPNDPMTSFIVAPSGITPSYVGPIAATIGHTGIVGDVNGEFTDVFQFTIGMAGMGLIGTGSGNITTGVNLDDFLSTTDLDITSVLVNGVSAMLTLEDADGIVCTMRGVGTCGANETWAANNVPITGGQLNTIEVSGFSRGLGSYGGNLTFTPARTAVPEPGTWALMLLGFGAIGWQIRRSKRSGAIAQFA